MMRNLLIILATAIIAEAAPYYQNYQQPQQGYQQQGYYPQRQSFPQQSNQQQNGYFYQPSNYQMNNQQQTPAPSSPLTSNDVVMNSAYSNLTDDKVAEIQGILNDDKQSVAQMQQRLQALGATWPEWDQEAIQEAVKGVGVTLAPRPVDLSEEAYKYYDKKQSILQNTNLTVAQIKTQIDELEAQTSPQIKQELDEKLQAQITTTTMEPSS